MAKLVILRLDGDVKKGLRVTLEVGSEGERPDLEIQGKLPSQPDLEQYLAFWQESYRGLELPTRLVPKQTVYYKPANELIKQCTDAAYQVGEHLKEWLESKEFGVINKRLREELSLDENIRVLIRSENEQLTHIPWHLWDFFDSYHNAEIAFSTSMYRRVSHVSPKRIRTAIKILAILGNSAGIDVEADRLALSKLSNADVTFLVEPHRKELNDKLWSQPWDILFFAGHSETVLNRGKIHINPYETLEIENLKKGIQEALKQGLQLVVLNSCDGLGLAYDLEQLCIPQMIVMREPIPDRVAQEFLKSFLQSFSSGKSLYKATREAREQLEGLENEFPCATWLPVIFQNPAEIPPTWKSLHGQPIERVDLEWENQYDSAQENKTVSETQVDKFKLAPPFRIDEIKSLSEVVRSNKLGELSNEGEVEHPIHPGYLGRIKYKSVSWAACLYPINDPKCWRKISTNEKVKVIGVIASNKLVVVPSDYVLSLPEERSIFSAIKSEIKTLFSRK